MIKQCYMYFECAFSESIMNLLSFPQIVIPVHLMNKSEVMIYVFEDYKFLFDLSHALRVTYRKYH